MELTENAGKIAREAGLEIRELSRKSSLKIQGKGSNDFVTEADIASQTLIKSRVAEMFPGDVVVGEEDNLSDPEVISMINNNPAGRHIWLVDPLDGTLNFIRGLLGYGVSIAVFDGSKTAAGAIYLPDRDELFLAEPSCGAFCNGRRLHVAERSRLSDAVAATGLPVCDMIWRRKYARWYEALASELQNIRELGSSVYEQSRVASGGLDFYFEIGPHPWDLAAGRLLVEEAGGVVTRLDGGEFDYGWGGAIVASRAIHSEVVRIMKSCGAPCEGLR